MAHPVCIRGAALCPAYTVVVFPITCQNVGCCTVTMQYK
uniref:Uncharacterized protein n=1 Tax=Anguilla anguilla TaxID=7936 RepID=A0A0E9QF09_ANGAN